MAMADDDLKLKITVRHINGIIHEFEMPHPEDETTVATFINNAIREGHLFLELDDSIMVIPIANIQDIEISPAPYRLPTHTLRDTTLVKILKYRQKD